MVIGLSKFIEYFKDYSNSYIIIGGTACDIIVENAGFVPRATDDIDIVLIVEALICHKSVYVTIIIQNFGNSEYILPLFCEFNFIIYICTIK